MFNLGLMFFNFEDKYLQNYFGFLGVFASYKEVSIMNEENTNYVDKSWILNELSSPKLYFLKSNVYFVFVYGFRSLSCKVQ